MSDRAKKEMTGSHGKPICFATLDLSHPPRNPDAHPGPQFKPMFVRETRGYAPALPSKQQEHADIDPDIKENARRSGFQRGFEAGRQKAHRLARESIEPDLVDFLQAYENLSAFHRDMADHTAERIVQTAIKICERILGGSIHSEAKKMDVLKQEIRQMIANRHRLDLCFHTEDLENLQELITSFQLTWPQSAAVEMSATEVVQKGAVVFENDKEINVAMEQDLLRRLPELLS